MTVRMIRVCDQKMGDIHPDEIEHMQAHGWQLVGNSPVGGGESPTAEAVKPAAGDEPLPAPKRTKRKGK